MTEDEKRLTELKEKLSHIPLSAPAVETVQPEIRTGTQYAMLPSMSAGIQLEPGNEED